jgi:hypothetical protein
METIVYKVRDSIPPSFIKDPKGIVEITWKEFIETKDVKNDLLQMLPIYKKIDEIYDINYIKVLGVDNNDEKFVDNLIYINPIEGLWYVGDATFSAKTSLKTPLLIDLPTAEDPPKDEAKLEQSEAKLEAKLEQSEEPKIEREKGECCIMIDATGSMQYVINTAANQAFEMAESINKQNPNVDFRYSCVGYRDPIDSKQDIHEVLNFTSNIVELREFLSKLHAKGGGDSPEDYVGAIDLVKTLDWTLDDNKVRKVVIMIADAPPHGKDFCCYSNHDEETDKLITRISWLASKGFMINCLSVDPSADCGYEEIEKIYRRNEGQYFSLVKLDLRPTRCEGGKISIRTKTGEQITVEIYPNETCEELLTEIAKLVGESDPSLIKLVNDLGLIPFTKEPIKRHGIFQRAFLFILKDDEKPEDFKHGFEKSLTSTVSRTCSITPK